MALTMGSAPFGHEPRGVFNDAVSVDGRVIWWEDSPRRVRGILAGEVVLDSRRVKLLHETGHIVRWYFPRADVREELLEPSDRHTHCPIKGDASYVSVRAGDRVSRDAAWTYPGPVAGAPPLAGYLSFFWDALDEWWEEDQQVFVHPRDPYHRCDVLETSRRVEVSVHGTTLVDTTDALVLFETGLPPRWYLKPEEIAPGVLREVDTRSACPYKGTASYYAVEAGGEVEAVLAWTYPEVQREVGPIAGRIAFFNERVDLVVDGEAQDRPQTPWSTTAWAKRQ